jgi:ribosome-binding protein aMBF1 (putative translation factor)
MADRTLPDRFDASPRTIRSLRGEGPRTKCSPELVRLIGQAIERALHNAGLTQQEAAYQMGYENHTMLARWISGVETPQLAKLWSLGKRFQIEFVTALAETTDAFDVRRVLESRRIA